MSPPNFSIPEGMNLTVYGKTSNCFLGVKKAPPSLVEGDFDGDGMPDKAAILRKNGVNKEALYVWLSLNSFQTPIILEKIEGTDFNQFSISVEKKGALIPSACQRGYPEACESGQPNKINLKSDGVWLVKCESAASMFYWDPPEKKFQRIWYSD